MKVLITGSQGLLGHQLLNFLPQQGHQVIGLNRKIADITRAEQIIPVIMSYSPDLVIHAAALTDLEYCEQHPEESYLVNALGTKYVAPVSYTHLTLPTN